jgi:hypothetical protein
VYYSFLRHFFFFLTRIIFVKSPLRAFNGDRALHNCCSPVPPTNGRASYTWHPRSTPPVDIPPRSFLLMIQPHFLASDAPMTNKPWLIYCLGFDRARHDGGRPAHHFDGTNPFHGYVGTCGWPRACPRWVSWFFFVPLNGATAACCRPSFKCTSFYAQNPVV